MLLSPPPPWDPPSSRQCAFSCLCRVRRASQHHPESVLDALQQALAEAVGAACVVDDVGAVDPVEGRLRQLVQVLGVLLEVLLVVLEQLLRRSVFLDVVAHHVRVPVGVSGGDKWGGVAVPLVSSTCIRGQEIPEPF